PYDCRCEGHDAHKLSEMRRSDSSGYAPIPCAAVKSDIGWSVNPKMTPLCVPSHIQEANIPWHCIFSHSLYEVMFHEAVYKSVQCKAFSSSGKCRFGDQCAHAHGPGELRSSLHLSHHRRAHATPL